MSLELEMPGGDPLPASEVLLIRALGQPQCWSYVVDVKQRGRGTEQVDRVADALQKGPTMVKPTWEGGALGPEAVVVHAEWKNGTDQLKIDAQATWTDSPDPFLPRRRVHKVSNMRQLIERFSNVAEPLKGVLNDAGPIEFGDGEKVCVIQDGVSDFAFLLYVMRQVPMHLDSPFPLVLLGSVSNDKWVVTSGAKDAFERWGEVSSRQVDLGVDNGFEQTQFGSHVDEQRTPDFPGGGYPAVIHWRPDSVYDSGAWDNWRSRDVPLFSQSNRAFGWRVEDRLYRPQVPEQLGWQTWVHTLPPEARISHEGPHAAVRPWVGLATVIDKTEGPWIKGRLDGFESGEDEIDIRLETPYSGTDGTRGLHFVPEVDTQVLVAWTGRFNDSIVLLGNTRSEAAEHPSPSMFLESAMTGEFDAIDIKEVKDVTVGSDMKMDVSSQTKVTSSGDMDLTGSGANVKLTGGMVKTGRA